MLIKQLSHTVQFDVDQIVASTDCLCPCGKLGLIPTEALDRRVPRDRAEARSLSSVHTTPETPLDMRSLPTIWNFPGVEKTLLPSQDSPHHDADSILAEAQAISLTLPINHLDVSESFEQF